MRVLKVTKGRKEGRMLKESRKRERHGENADIEGAQCGVTGLTSETNYCLVQRTILFLPFIKKNERTIFIE